MLDIELLARYLQEPRVCNRTKLFLDHKSKSARSSALVSTLQRIRSRESPYEPARKRCDTTTRVLHTKVHFEYSLRLHFTQEFRLHPLALLFVHRQSMTQLMVRGPFTIEKF
jgi:hypothetical protein